MAIRIQRHEGAAKDRRERRLLDGNARRLPRVMQGVDLGVFADDDGDFRAIAGTGRNEIVRTRGPKAEAKPVVELESHETRGLRDRRAAEKLMADGRVTVDGQVVSQMGAQVEPGQDVRVDGRPVRPEAEKRYIMYHKPAGEVTTVTDPEGRSTVLDKFRDFPVRLYPVGRLDYDSEGLLLLTNDGELTERMLHPSREVEKVYLARVSNQVTPEEARRLENGVMVDGRRTARAKVKLLSVKPLYTDMLVTIHEGRNRQVRKMVEQVGHQVVLLRRIRFGPLRLGDLPRGMWRELTPEELATLKAL